MRGQSPVNCPDSDVKEWGQNINLCLGTNEWSALFHFLDVINECKGNNKIWIYNEWVNQRTCPYDPILLRQTIAILLRKTLATLLRKPLAILLRKPLAILLRKPLAILLR